MTSGIDDASSDTRTRRRRRRRVLVLAVIAVVVVLRRTGVIDGLTDPDRLQQLADDGGIWAPIVVSLLFVLLVPVGVPGLVFVLPTSVAFSAPVAVGISLIGGYGSSGIGMWAARRIGRDRIEARLPPRFAGWNERIAQRGLIAVITLRIVTYLAAPADWLLGVTRISNRDLVLGTAVGLVPPTLVYVIGGGGLLDWLL